jgi:hypothetical protein
MGGEADDERGVRARGARHRGVIVILHDGIADASRTIEALDGILAAGERKGLRFVPVGELLAAGAS